MFDRFKSTMTRLILKSFEKQEKLATLKKGTYLLQHISFLFVWLWIYIDYIFLLLELKYASLHTIVPCTFFYIF